MSHSWDWDKPSISPNLIWQADTGKSEWETNTAFITSLGLFEFNHMTFGLINDQVLNGKLPGTAQLWDCVSLLAQYYHFIHNLWGLCQTSGLGVGEEYQKLKRQLGSKLDSKIESTMLKSSLLSWTPVYDMISKGPILIKRQLHCNLLRPCVLCGDCSFQLELERS